VLKELGTHFRRRLYVGAQESNHDEASHEIRCDMCKSCKSHPLPLQGAFIEVVLREQR